MAPTDVTPAEPVSPVQAELPPVAAPVAETPAPADNLFASDEALPIAGAAGLGILALAGVGLAMRRRRRRRLEAEDAQWQYAEAESEAPAEPLTAVEPQPGYMPEQAEPAFVRAFEPAPVAAVAAVPALAMARAPAMEATPGEPGEPIDGPVTELPEGFDLSRFGPHVQAAYQGPTDDNPSLSLKHRLRRASALDQLAEREAAEAPIAATPAEASAGKGAVPQHDKVDFMLARSGQKPAARPASITNGGPVFGN